MSYTPPVSTILPASFVANCHFWRLSGYHESVGEGNFSGAASCAEGEAGDAFVLYGLYLINGGWLVSSSP